MSVLGVDRNAETVTFSKDMMKVKVAPDAMRSRITGGVTRTNAPTLEAPRVCAAHSMAWSTPVRLAMTRRVAYGVVTTTLPITTPAKLVPTPARL